MADELEWADAYPGHEPHLDEIFCLTFIRGVDETEALRRMGGLPDTIAVRTLAELGARYTFEHGYPSLAAVLGLGEWTVVFEPSGFEGSSSVGPVSRGTAAVSVLRHDYASHRFGYAVGGAEVTGFNPHFPGDRYGTDRDRLLPAMIELGFPVDGDARFGGAISRSLRLAERITGVLPTFHALTGPLTSGHIEPWFGAGPRPGRGPDDPVAEIRRIVHRHDLTGTPGLAEALSAAQRGKPVDVTPDSPLGRQVRDWLAESRRAGVSLNDHGARGRMTDADRRRAFELGALAKAVGAALQQTHRH